MVIYSDHDIQFLRGGGTFLIHFTFKISEEFSKI